MKKTAARNVLNSGLIVGMLAIAFLCVSTREANASGLGVSLNLGKVSFGLGIGDNEPIYVAEPIVAPMPVPPPRPHYAPVPPPPPRHYVPPRPRYAPVPPPPPHRGPDPVFRGQAGPGPRPNNARYHSPVPGGGRSFGPGPGGPRF